MKHKITQKLALCFTAVLLIFSLVVGVLFLALFSEQSSQIYRTDLQTRAVAIADTLSDYIITGTINAENGTMPGHGQGQGGGYGVYLRLLNDIAMSDVWIVDQTAQTVSVGSGKNQISYNELPDGAIDLVSTVFTGEVAFGESFGSLLGNTSFTVGAPIFSAEGQVIAAVLLHTSAAEMASARETGIKMLGISLAFALVLSIIIAILVSKRFVRPLQDMEQATKLLAQGHYQVQTHIEQDDEVGSLAKHIDILAERLETASKQSAELEQMRKDYISNISHELRTPVTVMRGSLEALCDGVVSDAVKISEYHHQMLTESIHLERMVNDLLELSRLQNPNYAIEKTPLYLTDVLEDAIRSVRQIAAKKNVLLQYDRTTLHLLFKGDYGRLRQMFTAVLDNAVKFSNEGRQILIKVWADAFNSYISVTDTGTGISEKDLPHVFERFYKSNASDNEKGTGLGLAIAKQIADRHGIKIQVSSVQNEKTEFVFITAIDYSEQEQPTDIKN